MELIALIDGDIILYTTCWSAQTKGLDLEETKERVRSWMTEICLNTSNLFIGFLTGSDNFRRRLSPTYKANRSSEKPIWFSEIRDYMKKLGFISLRGIEADDGLGICATRFQSIVCTSDKDLRQIDAPYYNIKKHKYETSDDPDKEFWTQMIVGDQIDNVKGIEGAGPAKAKKVLKKNYSFETMMAYVEKYGKRGWKKFKDNYRLLYILRENKNFITPKVRKWSLIEQ